MAKRSTPPSQDVAWLTVSSAESREANVQATTENLVEFWRNRLGWGYLPFVVRCRDIIEKCQTEDDAAALLAKMGPESAQPHRQTVARAFFRHYGAKGYRAHPLTARRLELTKQPPLQASIHFGCIVVRQNEPVIVIPQPRKNFGLSDDQWAFYRWLARRVLVTTDAALLPIEFFDMSAGENGERIPRELREETIADLTTKDAVARIEIFVSAFDRAVKEAPPDQRSRRSEIAESLPLFSDRDT
jgi:hypothetical protein